MARPRHGLLRHGKGRLQALTPVAKACLLRIELRFDGCRSLKEKRRRLRGLRERLGQATNVAVCESGHQNAHQRSQWSIIAAAADALVVEKVLADAERLVERSLDAQLIGAEREWLC